MVTPQGTAQQSSQYRGGATTSSVFLVCILAGFALLMPGDLAGQTRQFSFDAHRDRRPVVVVFARDRNEDRVFAFHLGVSERWEAVQRHNIAFEDVLPGGHDIDAVAHRLGLGSRDFAVVLLDRSGDVRYITSDAGNLGEILMRLDLQHREGTAAPHGDGPPGSN